MRRIVVGKDKFYVQRLAEKIASLTSEIGYQHPKCYVHGNGSCSRKISKEHFISENLLRQIELNGTAKIAGFAWQKPETFDIRGIKHKSLAPKILCEYHNNALSPLDSTMGEFSKVIGDFDRALSPSVANLVSERKKFSGSDIEGWMLKCLIGMTASNNLKTANIKPECLALLFGSIDWPEGWGLYFKIPNKPIYHSSSFLIETKINPTNGLILAVEFCIRGLPFTLCMGKPDNPQSFGMHRPKEIIFEARTCEKVLELDWPGSHGESARLSHVGRYDGPPPDWKEWEKNG